MALVGGMALLWKFWPRATPEHRNLAEPEPWNRPKTTCTVIPTIHPSEDYWRDGFTETMLPGGTISSRSL